MKKFCLFLLLFSLGAAKVQAADTIAMTLSNSITCTGASSNTIQLNSWSWGSNEQLSGALLTGKLSLAQLSFNKVFDSCSDPMLKLYFMDTTLGTVTIQQSRSTGSATPQVLAVVTLNNAFFSSYGVGGTPSSPAAEYWALSFDKICVNIYKQSTTGQTTPGTQVCYANGAPV